MSRVHLLVDDLERVAFAARASEAGQSLSEWLRQAARERMARELPDRLASASDLDRFFEACDARETGTEPDWEEHLAVARRSRRQGLEPA